ncbi:MAG TPA: metal-dependent hydrolase [Noviherbaspirillum sp.]
MDNLSHSVASLLAGEIMHRSLPPEADENRHGLRRRLMLVTCALAGNFPDLDLVLTPLLPAPLGYLLHHRGHTHTVLYALPQMLLLAALIWALWPNARRLLGQSATARIGFLLALTTGFALHLLMDYLNSYGLHPFHPIDSRWVYGDMVFILEPVFWLAFGVPMIMSARRAAMRWLLLPVALALAYLGWRGFLVWQSLAVLLAMMAALALAGTKSHDGRPRLAPLLAGVALGLGFIAVQAGMSAQARQVVARHLQAADPQAVLLDAAMSPYPSNPVCWNFVAVERTSGQRDFRVSRGIVSLAPSQLPVPACPPAFLEGVLPADATADIALQARQETPLARLHALARKDCYFRDWLRFARMPWLERDSASDARYASSPRGNFSTLMLVEPGERGCERGVPQWGLPRADLLAEPAADNTRPAPQN